MKRNKIILTTILLILTTFFFGGCDVIIRNGLDVVIKEQPTAKIKIEMVSDVALSDEGVLSFSAVNRASSYKLNINGYETTTLFTAVGLLQLQNFNRPSDGKFNVSIISVPKYPDEYEQSDPYTDTLILSGISLNLPDITLVSKNLIKLDFDPKSLDYQLKVNNTVFNMEDIIDNKLDLTKVMSPSGRYEISFKALGDGVYVKNSGEVKYLYVYNSEKLQMPMVTNARLIGQTLKFDKVDNAYSYVIRDVLNNFYEIQENEIDLANKMMVLSIRSKSINSKVLQSEEQDSIEYFEKGDGSETNPFEINSYEAMRYIEYYERQGIAKHYKLTGDVVFPDMAFEPLEEGSNYMEIGSLCGVLDGGGYSIKNIVNATSRGFVGLFDSIASSGVVKNLIIDGFEMRTWRVLNGDGNIHPTGASVGVICKDNYGLVENITIKNCLLKAESDDVSTVTFNNGTVKNIRVENNEIFSGAEGGLISVVNSGTIFKSSIGVNKYTARKNIAAVCALNYGIIDDCDNRTDLFFEGSDELGGIVSWNEGTVIGCDNFASITGNNNVGGIVGKNGGLIENCTNEGAITGLFSVGGIVGQTEKLQSSLVVPYIGKISKCLNYGVITATDYAGGISGKNTNGFIELCANKGKVTSSKVSGGISGSCGIKGENNYWLNAGIYSSYNTGLVTGSISGGIAGENASWRYDTAIEPFNLVDGYGIYNCYSVNSKLVGLNNNQICDSYAISELTEGTFLINGSSSTLDKSDVTVTDLKSEQFVSNLNSCFDVWEKSGDYPILKWERTVSSNTLRRLSLHR